jgi:hypothetical protein
MNRSYRRVPARFASATRFRLRPATPAPFRALEENRFEQLKNELLRARLEQDWENSDCSHVRRAANDAAALAWLTPYPLLVFPVLFEETADVGLHRAKQQQSIRERSRELFALAV